MWLYLLFWTPSLISDFLDFFTYFFKDVLIFLIGASTETLRYPKCAGVWQLTIELICSIGPADFGWWLLLSCIDQYKFHWNHESASPVYIECVDFLSISIYTLSNTSLVNGDGYVYIECVNFDQQFYPHWTLLSFGSNRMNNYTKLYEWTFTIYLTLQRVGAT